MNLCIEFIGIMFQTHVGCRGKEKVTYLTCNFYPIESEIYLFIFRSFWNMGQFFCVLLLTVSAKVCRKLPALVVIYLLLEGFG